MASLATLSMEAMPYNCTWRILEYLDVLALREMRQVSKHYKLFSDADRLWQIHAASLLQKLSASQNAPTRGFRALFYQNFKLWSISTLTEGMASQNHVVSANPSLLNWGTAVINYPRVRNRKQYCEFLIEDSREGFLDNMHKIVIGLVPENFDHTVGHCIGEGQSFGYIASSGNKVGGGGAEPMAYGESYKNGDRVGLLADPTRNELRFYKNGVCQGVAFSNFLDENAQSYQFAVSLARSHMRVSILADVPTPEGTELYPEYRTSPPPPVISDLPLSSFPSDILTNVFQKLHISDINEMRLVRKDWARIASSDYIWRPTASYLVRDPEVLLLSGSNYASSSSKDSSGSLSESSSPSPTASTSTDTSEKSSASSSSSTESSLDRSTASSPSEEAPTTAVTHSRGQLTASTGSLSTFRLSVMRNIHRFSEIGRGPGLELSNDRTRVKSSSAVTYWSAIRLDYPRMQSGVHYAEFQIDVFRHGSIGNTWKMVCGVVSDEFDYVLTKWVGVDAKSFGFIAANGKAVGPLCKNLGTTYADGFMENDRIGVLVDFPADQILFYKNGVNLGVAFDGFSKQVQLERPESNYYFAISLARWGMQISVIPGAKCPDRNIAAC